MINNILYHIFNPRTRKNEEVSVDVNTRPNQVDSIQVFVSDLTMDELDEILSIQEYFGFKFLSRTDASPDMLKVKNFYPDVNLKNELITLTRIEKISPTEKVAQARTLFVRPKR